MSLKRSYLTFNRSSWKGTSLFALANWPTADGDGSCLLSEARWGNLALPQLGIIAIDFVTGPKF